MKFFKHFCNSYFKLSLKKYRREYQKKKKKRKKINIIYKLKNNNNQIKN